MTYSDGDLVSLGEGVPHPRGLGAFPRKLRRYVVEQKLLTLERAIHSMTGMPATVLRLPERGNVARGRDGRRGGFRSGRGARPRDV